MKNRGFTLIELMVVVIICLVVVVTCSRVVLTANGSNQEEAQQQAKAWANSMGVNVKGINCAKGDSDGDGYVSCTVAEDTGKGTKLHSIECTKAFTVNDGCRAPKMQINRVDTSWAD